MFDYWYHSTSTLFSQITVLLKRTTTKLHYIHQTHWEIKKCTLHIQDTKTQQIKVRLDCIDRLEKSLDTHNKWFQFHRGNQYTWLVNKVCSSVITKTKKHFPFSYYRKQVLIVKTYCRHNVFCDCKIITK